MRRKDTNEIRKRFTKEDCTFTSVCGCYVNSEKRIISKFKESFLNLDDDELHKYLEIAKKVLSGNLGNNIMKLDFPLDEDFTNEKQTSLMELKNSQLQDDDILDSFYQLVIDSYEYDENFLILMFHDAYDVQIKTTDNQSLDDSEEVYEYVLCAICPVKLSDAGLKYFEKENIITSRNRDWVVGLPNNGFVFPAFIDRSSNVNSVTYYTRRPKSPHPELMEKVLGCHSKLTPTIQKETFQSVIKESLGVADEEADMVFMDVHDNLNDVIEEHNHLYEDVEDPVPITLTKDYVEDLLIKSDIPKEATSRIEESYEESFGNDLPLAEKLIDKKVLKESSIIKTEKGLRKRVASLEIELDKMNDENADIVLKVKPDKVSKIKTETIDGQNCIVIPVDENEDTTVNGEGNII